MEDGILEPLAGQFGKKPLNGIDPGSRSRREVETPFGMILEPFVNLGRLVGGDTVENDMNGSTRLDPSAT